MRQLRLSHDRCHLIPPRRIFHLDLRNLSRLFSRPVTAKTCLTGEIVDMPSKKFVAYLMFFVQLRNSAWVCELDVFWAGLGQSVGFRWRRWIFWQAQHLLYFKGGPWFNELVQSRTTQVKKVKCDLQLHVENYWYKQVHEDLISFCKVLSLRKSKIFWWSWKVLVLRMLLISNSLIGRQDMLPFHVEVGRFHLFFYRPRRPLGRVEV